VKRKDYITETVSATVDTSLFSNPYSIAVSKANKKNCIGHYQFRGTSWRQKNC
jgi:hypothetical protein